MRRAATATRAVKLTAEREDLCGHFAQAGPAQRARWPSTWAPLALCFAPLWACGRSGYWSASARSAATCGFRDRSSSSRTPSASGGVHDARRRRGTSRDMGYCLKLHGASPAKAGGAFSCRGQRSGWYFILTAPWRGDSPLEFRGVGVKQNEKACLIEAGPLGC